MEVLQRLGPTALGQSSELFSNESLDVSAALLQLRSALKEQLIHGLAALICSVGRLLDDCYGRSLRDPFSF